MKFDDASFHYESFQRESNPWAFAAAHIGVYLGWAIRNGLMSDDHYAEEDPEGILDMVADGRMTGTEYLLDVCDGCLLEEDLSKECADFTKIFYDEYFLKGRIRPIDEFLSKRESEWDIAKVDALLNFAFKSWRNGEPLDRAFSLEARKRKWGIF